MTDVQSEGAVSQRLNAIAKNVDWLRENGLDDSDSLIRIKLIEGDAKGLYREATRDE